MLDDLVTRIDAALDERRRVALAIGSALFLAAVLASAATTPFDSDEVVTILTSDLPSRATMWAALADGIDVAPPLYALVASAIHSVVGAGLVSTRLPAIVAIWVVAVVVFLIVRRRTHALLGLAASLACVVISFPLAIDARGPGPAMACAAVALYAWTEIAGGRRRPPHAVLLAVALGAAPWWHDAGALIFLPVIAGELVRWRAAARGDWLVWTALAVAAIAALPLIALAGLGPAGHAAAGALAAVAHAYRDLLAPLTTPLLLIAWAAAIAIVIGTIALVVANRDVDLDTRRTPGYEIAAAIAFACLPAIAALIATVSGREIGARDVAIAVPGMVAGGTVFLNALTPRSGIADLIVAVALSLRVGGILLAALHSVIGGPPNPMRGHPALVQALEDAREPVVIAAGPRTLQILYYAEREWPGRTIVLADPEVAREIIGAADVDQQWLALAKWTPARIQQFFPYIIITHTFLVYESGPGWVVPKLRQLNATVQELATAEHGVVWRVRQRSAGAPRTP